MTEDEYRIAVNQQAIRHAASSLRMIIADSSHVIDIVELGRIKAQLLQWDAALLEHLKTTSSGD